MPVLADSRQIMSLRANLSWNFLGQVIAKVSLLIFHIVFANLVGIEGYGAFSFVFVGGLILLQPALDLGLNQLITKWVSRGNTEVVRLSFRIKGLTALGLIPLVLVIDTSGFCDRLVDGNQFPSVADSAWFFSDQYSSTIVVRNFARAGRFTP